MNAASKKILIADDDSSIRLVLSQAFTRLGFQVRATGNASTLLKWVSDGEGDLVVTDVMMPDENVFDVLPRIRKERPKLPIIVMSAQNTLLTAVNAADAGAFEYISKPFDLDDMVAAAKRALSRPAAGAGKWGAALPFAQLSHLQHRWRAISGQGADCVEAVSRLCHHRTLKPACSLLAVTSISRPESRFARMRRKPLGYRPLCPPKAPLPPVCRAGLC